MAERIKLFFIIFSFDIEEVGGGISRFVVSLSQALDPTKFEISICGLWDRGTQVEATRMRELNQAGIRAFACSRWDETHPYQSFMNSYRVLRKNLKDYPTDIIHSHSLFGDIAALWLNFEGKAPVILRTLHNELRTEWSRRPIRRLLLTNLLYPLVFDAEIGVSRFITNSMDERWLAHRLGRQAVMIHNALDIDRFSKPAGDRLSSRRNLGIPEQGFVAGSVGRLTRQKGYDILLEAVPAVIDKIPDFQLVLIGDGEEMDALKRRAKDLQIDKTVLFTGSRSDVDQLLGAMDLFVCSSRWEGFSTALMEAMAAGVPIVATDIPGNKELLEPGKSAWFVRPENPADLAEGLVKAYQNQELSQELARNAQEDVKSFGIDEIAKTHTGLYQYYYDKSYRSSWLNHRASDAQVRKITGSS